MTYFLRVFFKYYFYSSYFTKDKARLWTTLESRSLATTFSPLRLTRYLKNTCCSSLLWNMKMRSVIAHVEKEKSPGQPWLQKEITRSIAWLQKIHGQGGWGRGGQRSWSAVLPWHEALSWWRGQQAKHCRQSVQSRTL